MSEKRSVERKRGSALEWNPDRLDLYLDEHQKNGKSIMGKGLYRALAGKPLPQIEILDYLLEHPPLIPEEWKDVVAFFWSRLYQKKQRVLEQNHVVERDYILVRGLLYVGGRWISNYFSINHYWSDNWPAAVFKR